MATELFNAGRDLMKRGDYQSACPKLADSARLDPKVGTLARLAECEEKLGHLVEGRARWQQALNLARATNDDRAAHVQTEFARLDRIVPKLRIALDGQAPDGLAVRIDDAAVGPGSYGVALPVEPGRHVVAAAAPGKKPWSTTLTTTRDGAVTAVNVPALRDEPVQGPARAQPGPTPSEPPAEAHAGPWRTVGILVAATGVAALGVGTALAIHAKQRWSDSNAQGCNGDLCTQAGYDARNDARAAGNAATVFVVAGGVLAAGGIGLWLLAPKGEAAPRATLSPTIGRVAGLTVRGAW